MPKHRKSTQKIELSQFTSIAQAEDKALAQDCVRLLKDNEIAAEIEDAKKRTYIIKVQQGRFNEAYTIIQSHLTPEGFFDIHTEPAKQIKNPNHAA